MTISKQSASMFQFYIKCHFCKGKEKSHSARPKPKESPIKLDLDLSAIKFPKRGKSLIFSFHSSKDNLGSFALLPPFYAPHNKYFLYSNLYDTFRILIFKQVFFIVNFSYIFKISIIMTYSIFYVIFKYVNLFQKKIKFLCPNLRSIKLFVSRNLNCVT